MSIGTPVQNVHIGGYYGPSSPPSQQSGTPKSQAESIVDPSVVIFVNQTLGIKPGDDITAKMQALLNGLTTGMVLDIVFSIPGAYYINGAQQTGTVLSYTYSGSILLPAIAWDGLQNTVVRIRSVVPQSSGDP